MNRWIANRRSKVICSHIQTLRHGIIAKHITDHRVKNGRQVIKVEVADDTYHPLVFIYFSKKYEINYLSENTDLTRNSVRYGISDLPMYKDPTFFFAILCRIDYALKQYKEYKEWLEPSS